MTKAKLILGTANFGTKAYGVLQEPLSFNTIRDILNIAYSKGIRILESSEAYGCDDVLADKRFDLIYKGTNPFSLKRVLEQTARDGLLGLMYHHGHDTRPQRLPGHLPVTYTGASIYSFKQLLGDEDMVEVPLNLSNREFEAFTAPCKLVRSVFGRGELLKDHTIKECLDYVKGINNVHGVVIGVDSVEQLNEVITAWNS